MKKLLKPLSIVVNIILLVILFSIVTINGASGNFSNITIRYQLANDNIISEKTYQYNNNLKSALLIDYDTIEMTDENKEAIPDSIVEDGVTYEAAFAGWKLVSINGETVDEDYYYPDNDYIYGNDEPFASKTIDDGNGELVFEPFYGKRIYLRDKYNFNDLSNVYEDIGTAKIAWNNSKPYAHSIDEANADLNDDIKDVGNSIDNPVSNIDDAFKLLGTTGGEIYTVNHYTFSAPDNYYPYTSGTMKTGNFIWYLGQNITDGIVTFTGKDLGTYKMDNEKSHDASKLNASTFNSYYDNSYWYYHNTRGNDYVTGKALGMYVYFLCDTVLEEMNVVGYREIYTITDEGKSGDRYNNEVHWTASTNKRFVVMESLDYYKRTTSVTYTDSNKKTTNLFGTNTTNWSHSFVDGAKHTALSAGASGYLQLYIGSYARNDGTENIYATMYGERTGSSYTDGFYHIRIIFNKTGSGSAYSSANVNNIHINIDTIVTNNYYGILQGISYSFKCNFYGIYLNNVRFVTTCEPVSTTKSTTIKELVVEIDGSSSNNIIDSFYGGGYLNDSTGKTMSVNIGTASFYTYGNAKINNFYGGGNQIAVNTIIDNSLSIDIKGGTIGNLYGGCEGGSIEAKKKIEISIYSGTIDNIFGGGAGGITILSSGNSPRKLPGYMHDDDYNFIYTISKSLPTIYVRGCSLEIKKIKYQFDSGVQEHDVLAFSHFYNQDVISELKSYYESSITICLANALVKTGEGIYIDVYGGTVNGSIYGGGKNGAVESDININVQGGTVNGDIFGGGLGRDTMFSAKAGVSGPSGVSSTFIDKLGYEVYYSGNVNALTSDKYISAMQSTDNTYSYIVSHFKNLGYTSDAFINAIPKELLGKDIKNLNLLSTYNGQSIIEVYSAAVDTLGRIDGNTNITISGGNITGSVFGGSDGAVANITQNTNVKVTGGNILGSVYGGGNIALVHGNTDVTVASVNISDVFGGGNIGTINGHTSVTVNQDANITNVYAGSNQANVNQIKEGAGATNLYITGGTIENAYGGNNLSGEIGGLLNVEVSDGVITNLYGGGNQADTTQNTKVLITNGQITNAYGGGKAATVNEALTIINGGNIETIYGGGEGTKATTAAANVQVNSGTIKDLYGGGNAGATETVCIDLANGEITNNVYGGGYQGPTTTSVVNLVNSSIANDMFGGGYAGETTNATLNLNGGTVGNNVYGGGYQGPTTTSVVNLANSSIANDMFGGGYAGETTNATLNLNGGTVGNNAYGGGYQGPTTTSVVNLSNSSITKDLYGGGYAGETTNATLNLDGGIVENNTYGGGYQGYTDTTNVTLQGATVTGDLYGGGNAGETNQATVSVNSGSIDGTIYGGGEGILATTAQANVTINNNVNAVYGGGNAGNTGDISVTITNGTINGNVYGGGYAGTANTTTLNIIEAEGKYGTIKIEGDVFGGGEGETATVYTSTEVTVDLNLDLTVTEENITIDDISGQAHIHPTITNDYSYIAKSVYGGGDLGQLGIGTINTANNTANITKTATSTVTIKNGYIKQSVFGGGNGTPPDGIVYNINMGTIFGSTETNVNGGYIGENVYGGGRQSRLYAKATDATNVTLEVADSNPIYIGGSVFGGGDRGTNATSNASVPTTIGNANVNIIGNKDYTQIYFEKGGVYGDGNLCLVRGTKTINMIDFTTGSNTKLKTFYSLQRANVANLINTDIVLLGAVDLVEEGDSTIYSINRIGQLNMSDGSTVKLDSIVKGLGGIKSSVLPERNFINSNKANLNILTDQEIANYQNNSLVNIDQNNQITESTSQYSEVKNTICVANGLYLEVINEQGDYGAVIGLFTLALLYSNPGEGGGFVYASIDNSTGDFICETTYFDSTTYMPVVDADNLGIINNHYWFIQGTFINYIGSITGYIGSEEMKYPFDVVIPGPNTNLYYMLEHLESEKLLTLVTGANPTYTLVQRDITLDDKGKEIAIKFMIGSQEIGYLAVVDNKFVIKVGDRNVAPFGLDGTPNDSNKLLQYNPSLGNSIQVILYKSTEVTTEQFDIDFDFNFKIFTLENQYEVKLEGDKTAYFSVDNETFPYFNNDIALNDNKEWCFVVDGELVNTNIKLTFDGNYTTESIKSITKVQEYRQYNETNQFIFNLELNIIRLVPVESIFIGLNEQYSGVSLSDTIAITKGSSFTIEYQTKYIPSAFPYSKGSANMHWELSLYQYEYYFDSLGNFMTLDHNGNVVNISSTLQYIKADSGEVIDNKKIQVYYDSVNEVYYYNYIDENDNNRRMNFSSTIYDYNNPLPKGTKIIMIDYTDEEFPSYFYYICLSDTMSIDLLEFYQMGSKVQIKNLAESNLPAFITTYQSRGSTRIRERLVFMFDFHDAEWTASGEIFNANITLKHNYGANSNAVDIMDYIKSTDDGFAREYPKTGEFTVGLNATGIESEGTDGFNGSFLKEEYTTAETAEIKVTIKQSSAYVNTQLADGKLAIVISMVSGVFPNGITFEYEDKHYPAYGNTYVVIPVEKYGEHIIRVNNILGTIETEIGKDTHNSMFKATLCHLVSDEHFGLFENRDNNSNDIDDYTVITPPVTTVVDKPIFSLSIDVEEHIVKQGDNLIVSFTTRCNKPSNEITRGEIHNATGIVDPTTFMSKYVIEDNKYVITLKEDVEPGAYRIKIIYADKSEYVTIIITDKDS